MRKTQLLLLTSILLSLMTITAFANPDPEASRIAKRDAILLEIKPPAIPTQTVSLLSFGAKGDSITDCKPAFDKAMKSAAQHHGLKIVLPAGVYFINGPIHLVSNVCIELQKGARLKFTSDPARYLPMVFTSWEGTLLYNYSPFIYGYQLENISITGEGTIDGNASTTFNTWKNKQEKAQMTSRDMNHNATPLKERIFGANHFLRPQLIQLFECKNILIEGVKITNSPFWCVHLLKSENITVRRVRYDAKNINNDGIDPEYSRNILIEDVDFDNGDDNVAIKAGRDHEGRATAMPSENIIIRNCRFKGLHGVVIGSEMSAGVRNVFIDSRPTMSRDEFTQRRRSSQGLNDRDVRILRANLEAIEAVSPRKVLHPAGVLPKPASGLPELYGVAPSYSLIRSQKIAEGTPLSATSPITNPTRFSLSRKTS